MGNLCWKSEENNKLENILKIDNPLYYDSKDINVVNQMELYQSPDWDEGNKTESKHYSAVFLDKTSQTLDSQDSRRLKRFCEIEHIKLLSKKPKVFAAIQFNDFMNPINAGELEISTFYLFYRYTEDAQTHTMKWPLDKIKWYMFSQNALFSFQCSPSFEADSHIYKFNCQKCSVMREQLKMQTHNLKNLERNMLENFVGNPI